MGPYVHNLTCGECTGGYDLHPGTGDCFLPDIFRTFSGWNETTMNPAFTGVLVKDRRRVFPPPQLTPVKDKFQGYTNFDFMAIRYEIDFLATVDLGCDLAVSADTSLTEPVRLDRTAAGPVGIDAPFDQLRVKVFNQVDRPAFLRFTVTSAGNFTFDLCDSLYTTSATLYHRNSSNYGGAVHDGTLDTFPALDDMVERTNGMSVHDWISESQAGYNGQFIPNGFNVLFGSKVQWSGGCRMGASANRTVHLPAGEYTLAIRIFPLYNDVGGTYVVRMGCHPGAAATSPQGTGDPGGLAVDSRTGVISGSPLKPGQNYKMRLLAVDGAGKKTVVKNWQFDVVETVFRTIDTWNATELNSTRRIADEYHVSDFITIGAPGVSKADLFVNPSTPDEAVRRKRDDHTDGVVYLMSAQLDGDPIGCTMAAAQAQVLHGDDGHRKWASNTAARM